MECPTCQYQKICKNGYHRRKQRYKCSACGRQFLESYSDKGYDNRIKERCLKMYVNGLGFRAIERVMNVHHTTVINWVKQVARPLPDAPTAEEIPEIAQLDELQTFVGKKKQDLVVDSGK